MNQENTSGNMDNMNPWYTSTFASIKKFGKYMMQNAEQENLNKDGNVPLFFRNPSTLAFYKQIARYYTDNDLNFKDKK